MKRGLRRLAGVLDVLVGHVWPKGPVSFDRLEVWQRQLAGHPQSRTVMFNARVVPLALLTCAGCEEEPGCAALSGGDGSHHSMGDPSHAKKWPLSAGVNPSITSSSCFAARIGSNSLPAGTLRWNGRESSVSTVPGCSATAITWGARRLSSIASVRVSWFCAAFDAR